MEHYVYFINVDDEYIKYGRSSSIHTRLKDHHRCFINNYMLKEKLDIKCMIAMETEELSKETERCIKKCIKLHQKEVAKYGHTELFLLEELDKYTNLSVRYLNWMIKHYNITDNTNHKILTQEEINDIYENKENKSCNPSVAKRPKGSDNRKNKTCLRCGKEIMRLDQHLRNKNECQAIYLNVPREEILYNYDNLFSRFVELRHCGKKKSKCHICNKLIMSKNMSRHMKTVHNTQNTTVNGDMIHGDQINGDELKDSYKNSQ